MTRVGGPIPATTAGTLGIHPHQGTALPDTYYLDKLADPDTINTAPEATLPALADRGVLGEMSVRSSLTEGRNHDE